MEGLFKLPDHIPKMKTYGLEANLFHITHNNLSPKKLMFVVVISIPLVMLMCSLTIEGSKHGQVYGNNASIY